MKTVTIPTNMKPFWECEINGVKYSYPAGTEQSVPDEVAALIDNYNAMLPKENPPETDEQMATRIAEEKIAEANVVVDITGVELDNTLKTITPKFTKELFDKVVKGDYNTPLTLVFVYDDIEYRVHGYQVDDQEIHFCAHVDGESGITAFADVIVVQHPAQANQIAASIVVTSMPAPSSGE